MIEAPLSEVSVLKLFSVNFVFSTPIPSTHSDAFHIPKSIPGQQEIIKIQSLFSWKAVLPIDTLSQCKSESGGDSVLLRVLERLSSPTMSSHTFNSHQPDSFKSVSCHKQRRHKEWMLSEVCPSSIKHMDSKADIHQISVCIGVCICHFKPKSFILHNFSL